MGTLTTHRPNSKELLTEILEEEQWWRTLKLLVKFLESKGVIEVQIKFGFILDRDLKGEPQPGRRMVSLTELESEIRRGLDEGTIEWAGMSDFIFEAVDVDLAFMLCNDADLHFASPNVSVLTELAHEIRASGIKVYDSGKPIWKHPCPLVVETPRKHIQRA